MAKKKQNNSQSSISPEKYIRTKARTLPIEKCLINANWKEAGEASIIVVRQHKSGNRTLGVYLVDTFCLGIKDAFYFFNQDFIEYENIEERFTETFETKEISYNEAHNIIWGAMSYAEELGFQPAKGFSTTKYVLEEDTEEIPLIEYEFGRDGKPFLIAHTRLEASKCFSVLEKSVGAGNFEYLIREDEDEDEYDPYEEVDDEDDEFEEYYMPPVITEYNYQYPDYPTELNYKHNELDILLEPDNYKLERETIDSILAINREELLSDLENILLYEMGQGCSEVPWTCWDAPESYVVLHVLLLLGQLRASEKQDLVLEVMRQSDEFAEYHLGDWAEMISLVLYYVSNDKSDKLLFDYMKEPSLCGSLRVYASEAMVFALVDCPEKRNEIIEWFRNLLNFYLDNTTNSEVFDSTLVAMIVAHLIDIKAKELLPEIKKLYDTELVDISICGDYEDVESLMSQEYLDTYKLLDIYEFYDKL